MKNRSLLLPLSVAAVSGAAALTHEMLWTRRLIDLLGATHEASARVIACFFLGLSLGSAVIARRWSNVRRPWCAAAIVELAVALFCLPVLFLPELYAGLWQQLGAAQLVSSAGQLGKLAMSAIVVIPPAFCMGMTIPLMTSGILRSHGTAPSRDVWLYAFNTAGGVLGILLAVNLLLWWFGVRGAILTAILMNVVVAALCQRLDRRQLLDGRSSLDVTVNAGARTTPATVTTSKSQTQDPKTGWPLPLRILGLGFVSGFGVLALEILCIHLFSHVVSTINATAAVLAGFISMLFLSALVVPFIVPRVISAERALFTALMATAVAVVLIPNTFVSVTDDLNRSFENAGSTFSFDVSVITCVTVVVGIAVVMAGFVFPLSVMLLHTDEVSAVRNWGLLLAANGIGGAVGAEFANHGLMPWFGLYPSFAVIALVYVAIGIADSARDRRPRIWAKLCFSAVAVLFIYVVNAVVVPRLPVVAGQDTARIVDVIPGPDGVLSVVERNFDLPIGRHVSRSIAWNSQYTLGGSLSRYDEQRQAVFPLVVHPDPKSVAFLGLATGITAGTALDMPAVECVTVIELSQQVVDCAQEYFGAYNRHIADDSRSHVVVEDARTYIAASEAEFDVIVADLFRPYATGEGRLFTVEHFQSAKRALRDGGLYAHWLPCHQLSEPEFDVIVASFLHVFDEAELWRVNLKSQFTAVGLFGFRNGKLSFTGLSERCQKMRDQGKIKDPPSRHAESIAMHYIGRLTRTDVGSEPLNTLDNIWLELNAGRRYCVDDANRLSLMDANWPAFEERLYERVARNPNAAGGLAKWGAVGRKVSHWYYEASRANRNPRHVQQLLQEAQDSLPSSLMNDEDADWEFWPTY